MNTEEDQNQTTEQDAPEVKSPETEAKEGLSSAGSFSVPGYPEKEENEEPKAEPTPEEQPKGPKLPEQSIIALSKKEYDNLSGAIRERVVLSKDLDKAKNVEQMILDLIGEHHNVDVLGNQIQLQGNNLIVTHVKPLMKAAPPESNQKLEGSPKK